ncbi:MAG: C1 family peptidase [Candidatus Paceibacterota bacterium]
MISRKKILLTIIPILLIFEKAFALENTYPAIAGKVINESSGFLDFVGYGFALCVTLGGVIMFAVLIKAGLKMVTGAGSGIEAKKEIKRSSIGLFILLCTYLILNTINSALVDPQSIDQPCINGIDITTSQKADGSGEEKLYDICVKNSMPDITKLEEVRASSFPSCLVKSVIAYSEKDYKGKVKEIFNDTTNKTKDCNYEVTGLNDAKSIKIISKKTGIYLYDEEDYKTNRSDTPVFFDIGSDDLNKINFGNRTKSINVIGADYSTDPRPVTNDPSDSIIYDYYGAFIFENPGYRGKCLAIDSNNDSLQGTDKAIGSVSLVAKSAAAKDEPLGVSSVIVLDKEIHSKKKKEKSYIYLYAVKDCGKNMNNDKKTSEKTDKNVGKEKNIMEENKIFSLVKPAIAVLNEIPDSKDVFYGIIKNIKNYFESEKEVAQNTDIKSIAYAASSSYPASFNWNNMHGENWLTSFKNQGAVGTCWAHAAAGTLESQIRLYFNQPDMEINLSEQMFVDCTTGVASSPYVGNQVYISPNPYNNTSLECLYTEKNLDTVSQRGIADESCNPYDERDVSLIPGVTVCKSQTCSNWEERVWKNTDEKGYGFLGGINMGDAHCTKKEWNLTEDDLKRLLILSGPLDVGMQMINFSGPVGGHAMVLVGYETTGSGETTWIFKNSWGSSNYGAFGPGLEMDGGYLKATVPISRLWYGSLPIGPFIPPENSSYWPAGFDNEIKCTDKDGDGYCYWGSSAAMPPSCSSLSCKKEKDCNDADKENSIYDSYLNCGNTGGPSDECTDNDGDGYCYWTSLMKPPTCSKECNKDKDCDDDSKEVKGPNSNGECFTGEYIPGSNISPNEPIPDPIIDPSFGVGGLYDVCQIEIPEVTKETVIMDLEKLISEECDGKFKKTADGKTYDITSFKFGGPARVLIKGSTGNCLFWDSSSVEKTGSCVNELRGSDVFDTSLVSNTIGKATRPKSIIIFPKN